MDGAQLFQRQAGPRLENGDATARRILDSRNVRREGAKDHQEVASRRGINENEWSTARVSICFIACLKASPLDGVLESVIYGARIAPIVDEEVKKALNKLRSTTAARALDKIFKHSSARTDQAYHGTSRDLANEIVENGFQMQENEQNWMGTGVYFFEGSFSEAQSWAKNHKGFNSPAVIRSVVEYGKCLRLTEELHCYAVRKFKSAMQDTYGVILSEPAALGALSLMLEIDTIRGAQVKGGAISSAASYKGSWTAGLPVQIIICVCKLQRIKNSEIVGEPQ
jgi:hypothetical protein